MALVNWALKLWPRNATVTPAQTDWSHYAHGCQINVLCVGRTTVAGDRLRDIVVGFILLNDITARMDLRKSHMAIPRDGTYDMYAEVSPDEVIRVGYRIDGTIRRSASFRVSVKYAAYALRDSQWVEVMRGDHTIDLERQT